MRFFRLDLKRMYSGRSLIAMCLILPILVILLFSSIVVPMLRTSENLHYNVAIYDADGSEDVRQFVHQLVNSHALSDLIVVYPVQDLETGYRLIKEDQVSVLIHIPEQLFEKIKAREEAAIEIISLDRHALESSLVTTTLNQSLVAVGQGQNQIDEARDLLLQQGISALDADRFLRTTTDISISNYMQRRDVLGAQGAVSPLGEYLPIEYYLIAVYIFFAALAMLPLIRFTNKDLHSIIMQRGLLSELHSWRFYLIRLLSGTILISSVLAILIPVSRLLRFADLYLGAVTSSTAAVLTAIFLQSLTLSAMALAIASWIRKADSAMWVGFYFALFMAISGGVIIPEGALPVWLSLSGRYLPLRSGMRALSNAVFNYEATTFWSEIVWLLPSLFLLTAIGLAGFRFCENNNTRRADL